MRAKELVREQKKKLKEQKEHEEDLGVELQEQVPVNESDIDTEIDEDYLEKDIDIDKPDIAGDGNEKLDKEVIRFVLFSVMLWYVYQQLNETMSRT